MSENKKIAIASGAGDGKLATVVQCLSDPTKFGFVISNPDGSAVTGGGPGSDTTARHRNGDTIGAKKTIGSIDNSDIGIIRNNTEMMTFTSTSILFGSSAYDEVNNRLGIGVATPLAALHLKAGTATAGTAPIKFTPGVLMTASEQGVMEYTNDDLYFSILTSVPSASYINKLPPAYSSTYVKSTTEYNASFVANQATNIGLSLTGTWSGNAWVADSTNGMTNQRFHIDLGSSIIINRIYYENGHASGGSTLNGVKDFTLWGSNTAADFADLTYANNGTWTQITGVSQSTFDQHIAADQADPKYITVSNTTAYRYYAFKFAGTWGVSTYMSVRKLVLQYGTPSSRRGIILNDGSNLVSGRIPFATTNGRLMDSSSLNWDVANNRLGIGTAAPLVKLHVLNGDAATLTYPIKRGRADNAVNGALGQDPSIDNAILIGSTTTHAVSFIIGGNRRVSIDTSGNLQFSNDAAKKFDVATTANTVAGRALTISAGSTVTAGTADLAGGNLNLNSGLGKGTGASNIILSTGRTLTTGSTLQTLTPAMTINGNGNVMIGNTSTYTLDGTSLSLLVQGTAGSSTHYGVIGSYRQANSVGFGTGYGMFFNNSASVAKLYAYFNGFIESATAGSENGGLSFWTRRSGTLTEAMRIIGSGKVGIGTPTPSTQFEIYGTTAGISLTRIGDESFIRLSDAGYANGGQIRGLSGVVGLRITNASADTEWMRIISSGNIGIKTTTPSYLLSLGGTATRTIGMERMTTAATAGQNLTLLAGGAVSGGTDLNGGDNIVSCGIATGNGMGGITFKTVAANQGTGTTDRTPTEKFRLTGDGGYAIKLTNKTGANTIKGTVVYTDPAVDMSFEINPLDGDMPIGVVLDSGVADGSEAWIVVAGIAKVLLVDTVATTRGYIAYSSATTAGRIDTEATIPAAATHFREIGHTLESIGAGTDVLCKCILHFN